MLSERLSERRGTSALLFSFAAGLLAVAIGGCQGNGEGQRCSTQDDPGSSTSSVDNAGASDCSGGNLCYPVATLGGIAQSYATTSDPYLGICCPVQRSATDPVAICATQSSPINDDAGFPDAGASDAFSAADVSVDLDSGSDGSASDASTSDASTSDASTSDAGISDAGQAPSLDATPG